MVSTTIKHGLQFTTFIHPYSHLPPRIFVFVVADTPGVGEQRAGEGRQLPTLGIRNQDDVAVGPGPGLADRAVAIDNHVMGALSRRLVRSRTFWRGRGTG